MVSVWDWGAVNGFVHDLAPADRRNPVVPPGTPIYGPSQSHDMLVWFDPVNHKEGRNQDPHAGYRPARRPARWARWPVPAGSIGRSAVAVALLADEELWNVASEPRSGQMDHKGRILAGFRIRRDEKQPAFCGRGQRTSSRATTARSASELEHRGQADRLLRSEDPGVDTHRWFDHSDFASNADHTLYSGMNNVVGWINTRTFDETGDEQASQGWCPAVLDTNGDGTITEWTEPDQPIDPTKDHRINFTCYSVGSSPVDHAAWCNGTAPRSFGSSGARIQPETCKAEVYQGRSHMVNATT